MAAGVSVMPKNSFLTAYFPACWRSVHQMIPATWTADVEPEAAKGGKLRQLPMTKGDKKRQVHCRLLSLFAAPFLRVCSDLY
jgi:hypothetical protein